MGDMVVDTMMDSLNQEVWIWKTRLVNPKVCHIVKVTIESKVLEKKMADRTDWLRSSVKKKNNILYLIECNP